MEKILEQLLHQFGGTKWKEVSTDELKEVCATTLLEYASTKVSSPEYVLCNNIIKKIKKQVTSEKILFVLSESLFNEE